MIADIPSINAADFVIIVPYTQQKMVYKHTLKNHEELGQNEIVTSTTFQGKERAIPFVDLTVAKNLNGAVGFPADKRRLAVSATSRRCLDLSLETRTTHTELLIQSRLLMR